MSDIPVTPFGLLSAADQNRIRDAGREGREWYSNSGWVYDGSEAICSSVVYRFKYLTALTEERVREIIREEKEK